MYHFIVKGVALELLGQYDIIAWCNQLKKNKNPFQIDNVDILATIPRVSQALDSEDFKDFSSDELFTGSDQRMLPKNMYLEFIAPRKLKISESDIPPLLPGQLLVAMNCSLISPGI